MCKGSSVALLPPKAQGEAEASVRLFSDGALSPNPQLCLSRESFLGFCLEKPKLFQWTSKLGHPLWPD